YVLLLDLFFLCTPTVTSEIHSLSLHDALPISQALLILADLYQVLGMTEVSEAKLKEAARILPDESLIEFALAELYFSINKFDEADRKSTRLNSSHVSISYAVFCLKKKKNNKTK